MEPMSRVRFNVAANIAGQIWSLLLAIICTPFFIKLLGIEGYALIAFYVVLQGTLQILDFGFATTVNREVARLSPKASAADIRELGEFAATAQRWYWALGFATGIVMYFATPYIASTWLNPGSIPQNDLTDSARLFGLLVCLQWPVSFYQNGLVGMQRQVTLNLITIPFSALSNLGGLLFLWLGPRSVASLLSWQAFILLIQLGVARYQFWGCLAVPRGGRRVRIGVMKDKWRFSLGMGGISVAGFLLTHLDKLVLSRLLSLESFGHYSLAATLARGLYVMTTPVFNAYFPRLSALARGSDKVSMRLCYHSAAQVMSVLILPLAVTIGFFSHEIALLWLRDSSVSKTIAPIAGLLVVGNCLNGLMNIPFALQLAYGNTKIGLYISVCLVAVLVPAMILAVSQYGVTGGAAAWGIMNGLYLLIALPLTHKYLLPGETANWVKFDVLPPLVAALAIAGIGRAALEPGQPMVATLVAVGLIWLLATAVAALSARQVRSVVRQMIDIRT
ncbi:MAG TPA: oligosaccharide flippase family protein [Burkholderiales bacterium]|jgi:O-antigen/teichoic acid export membrane protein|nr:oligosaccharide flippase family protein [Burkholderiales bacterium]